MPFLSKDFTLLSRMFSKVITKNLFHYPLPIISGFLISAKGLRYLNDLNVQQFRFWRIGWAAMRVSVAGNLESVVGFQTACRNGYPVL